MLGADELAQCRASLSRRLGALLDQREGSAGAGTEPAAAEVHDLKDEAFAGQLANLRGMARDQMESEVDAIQTALRRIEQGTYGRCEDCDAEIGRERLLAQPSAGRCIRCQERAERPGTAR